ncbi:MAG: tRNA lysidine(34) synthetase TilS, partial [Acidimicrobiales bacterium]
MVLVALKDDGGAGLAPLLARCSFPPAGTAVDLAVSGGADSLALLVLARAGGLVARAVHVDHGLRPDSGADADVVASAAVAFGASFELRRIAVAPGPNLEARARAARYAVLGPGVLTGHTADDQAETVLLNLLRGAGLDGLSGMIANDRVRRPILALRRHETAAVCAAAGLRPAEDPTNADLRFRRNQVRHQLLPVLDRLAGRDVAAVLARQAGLLADDAALLDELAGALDPCDARALAAAPVP